jgi:hypothetical protein
MTDLVLDDFATAAPTAAWTVFTDRVMGGVSNAQGAVAEVRGRRALRLVGQVSLERNGGFVQMARALQPACDARAFAGLALTVCGAPGSYFVHLRTGETRAPWQYYGAELPVARDWRTVVLPWSAFAPVSLAAPLNVSGLTRIGIVGAKVAFLADVALARLALVAREDR